MRSSHVLSLKFTVSATKTSPSQCPIESPIHEGPRAVSDGRPHDTALGPSWMGDSIGHWEGDVLVADTVNFNDKTWLDRMGHPHSDALHIVERIRRVDHDHLVDDLTIEDPKAYTKPWTAHLDFLLRPNWTLGEQFCEDEESFQTFDKKAATPEK